MLKKGKTSHQNDEDALVRMTKYKSDAEEQQIKEEAITKWIGCIGFPITTVEYKDFVLMRENIDKRLTLPKKTKINNLIKNHYKGYNH